MKLNIGLPDPSRTAVTEVLQPLLADELALYVATRGAHWNVVGPQFAMLHGFFEQQYEALDEIMDDVAERIRALGEPAQAALAGLASRKRIDDGAAAAGSAPKMIESLLVAHEAVIRQLRRDVGSVSELGDEGTTDFLTGLMEQHEKMAWMLRAHLA